MLFGSAFILIERIMPKSDDTRYASELPSLFAWDSSYNNSEVEKAKKIALATRRTEFNLNCDKALNHRDLIQKDMEQRGFPPVKKVSWQGNYNRNNNGSPADVVFENHPVGGISVKDGSDIVHNGGLKDFNTEVKKPRGVDLFRHLAPVEFNHMLRRIVSDLLNSLDLGLSWTRPRKSDFGKYAITRVDDDKFLLKFKEGQKIFTRQELLTGTCLSKKGISKPIHGKWWRVFGDYYQEQLIGNRKHTYRAERDALFSILYPKIEELCKNIIASNPEKLCQYIGFNEKPYYVSDLHNDKIYFVNTKLDVINKIKLRIINKDKDHTFGSGFELGCEVWLEDVSDSAALDFYVCYNSGTFQTNPVIKIQNFKDKEKLWQRIA